MRDGKVDHLRVRISDILRHLWGPSAERDDGGL